MKAKYSQMNLHFYKQDINSLSSSAAVWINV